jgi:hypothetical protein
MEKRSDRAVGCTLCWAAGDRVSRNRYSWFDLLNDYMECLPNSKNENIFQPLYVVECLKFLLYFMNKTASLENHQ